MLKNETNYGFYSKVLNKPFNTVEELKKAEAEYAAAEEAKQTAVSVKKSKAEEIEKAYQKYLDVRKDAKKIIDDAKAKAAELLKEAEDNYYNLRNEFIKEYGSFHQSYYSDGKTETVSISDLVNSVFDSFFRF